MKKNQFIVVEGIDGSGKTTICNYIITLLHNINIHNIIYTHEPGGTPLAEKLRQLIKYSKNEILSNRTELLLIYASRLQLLDNILRPNINNCWILSDRYDLSSYAYQIGGRGINEKDILFFQKFIINNIKPNITIYLDVNPVISLNRIQLRKKDRIEKESLIFFTKVRQYYLKIAKQDNNIIIIDANQNLYDVKLTVKKVIMKWLKN
ncbi:dTMP kinase [Enterobacteriaceae endosymbiont of Plateumaris pusilla]|uniref:dTMP kinase n=1 Tax=Enterobacteriaceae endosymbiont of Plateumaris pusilla TaxID=2675795 RepID=UPI00144A14AD|nr:dTMP kinase [Enterobacteriaceae endosymbiont of Plateumaris pusilla]QJC29394.1 dTMP kinase [Enterobacteriaceae endosymbiont of Plateumaris pusilla]